MWRYRARTRVIFPSIVMVGVIVVSGCERHISAVPEVRPVRVSTVKLESVDDIVRYSAVIRPRIEANVGFRISGKVVERLVEVGSRIEAGTPLARLDSADLELQLRAAAAQLAAAQADAANARSEFTRYAQLRKGKWTTIQEYDRRKMALDRTEARVHEVEAQLGILRNTRRYTTLVADGPGIVTSVSVEPGQVVAEGQTAFRIAQFGEVEAVANIPEQQVGSLTGCAFTAELWSLPGTAIIGRLRELAPSADPGTRTYQARVTLVDPPPEIQLGMTASLQARLPRPGQFARLPLTALSQHGADPAVFVVNAAGNGIELRPVTVSAYVGDMVMVASGITNGDRVVTAGVHKLDPAQKVRIWTESAQ